MSRLRVPAAVLALATIGFLAPASAARAATQLTATINCDPATGVITTSAAGTLLAPGQPPTAVRVEFRRTGGVQVTATTSTILAPSTLPYAVPATTTSSGDISAVGYRGRFAPATSLYYREAIQVTFKNAATGETYTTREASCAYDQRSTVTLTCDPPAGTVTAAVTGHDGQAGAETGAGRPTIVGYRTAEISQATADGPRFRSEPLGSAWEVTHRLTQAADGTWADTGYVHPITNHPYYYAEELTVGVLDLNGTIVGSGTAQCVLYDGSLTPAGGER